MKKNLGLQNPIKSKIGNKSFLGKTLKVVLPHGPKKNACAFPSSQIHVHQETGVTHSCQEIIPYCTMAARMFLVMLFHQKLYHGFCQIVVWLHQKPGGTVVNVGQYYWTRGF